MGDIYINVEGKGQYTATSCWFSSYRILFSWKKADERVIPTRIVNAGLDFDAMLKRGMYSEEFIKTGTALGLVGRAATSVREYSLETWGDRLSAYGPHWVATQKSGAGHAIVVYGVDKGAGQLHIYDPYNRFEVGTVEKAYWTLDEMQRRLAIYPFAVQVWDS